MTSNPTDTERLRIRDEADLCVVCGLCLPHCPTYAQTLHEADSPRGRIALIRALATGQLQPDAALHDHLDQCLACRACEDFCPSRVPYGRLIAAGRALLMPRHTPPAARLLANRPLLRLAAAGAHLYQTSGLQWLARRSGLLRALGAERLDALLPPAQPVQRWQPAPTPQRAPRVALFRGCATDAFDRATNDAARQLLNRLGVAVIEPRGQTCCGAPSHYRGVPAHAERLARENLQAFGAEPVDAIVTTASGCGAQLADYPAIYRQAVPDDWRVIDISSYLAELDWPQQARPQRCEARVVVHAPCSLRNVLHTAEAPVELLRRVPGLEVIPVAGHCCGGAGSYMVEQPEMAEALRRPLVERIRELAPDFVVTSNIGCSLHVGAGLREAGVVAEMLHPVTLLARLLPAI